MKKPSLTPQTELRPLSKREILDWIRNCKDPCDLYMIGNQALLQLAHLAIDAPVAIRKEISTAKGMARND